MHARDVRKDKFFTRRMSMKKKKILFVLSGALLLLTLALFSGCDSNLEDEASITQVYKSSDLTEYSGSGDVRIFNEEKNEYLPGTAGTVANGKLTLKLPQTVEDKYLKSIQENNIPDSVHVSPVDGKALNAEFHLIIGEDRHQLSYEKMDGNKRYDSVMYLYAAKDFAISGSGPNEDGKTITYDTQMKKGWNRIHVQFESATIIMTTKPDGLPSDMKWVINDY
jgi:hypothetical protein